MHLRAAAHITTIFSERGDTIQVATEFGPAIAYTSLTGNVVVGDRVLINRTANVLGLGTGGYDFVIARLSREEDHPARASGHIVKLRYTPSQIAVTTLEELPELAEVWDKDLEGTPVVACQLHSQIAHVAAAAASSNKRAVYIMTDTACLISSFSNMVRELKSSGLIAGHITAGQACGGDYEAVTIHSAMLAAKHYLGADIVVIGQGPGNAGTGTKYGFGGVDQAHLLDVCAALGGTPVAVVRASTADPRERHQGISHHTLTTLKLVRSACTIPIPAGMISTGIEPRHQVVEVANLQPSFEILDSLGIRVTTMGRDAQCDKLFFEAAAAAGTYASDLKGTP